MLFGDDNKKRQVQSLRQQQVPFRGWVLKSNDQCNSKGEDKIQGSFTTFRMTAFFVVKRKGS
jgi:hypothetical protein